MAAQSKAFERCGLAWVHLALVCGGACCWLRWACLRQAHGRQVGPPPGAGGAVGVMAAGRGMGAGCMDRTLMRSTANIKSRRILSSALL